MSANSVTTYGGTHRPTREDNRLRVEDREAHDWYRFVLSFPPHLVRDYVERFGLTSRHRVLDPFCGTGTTLVECKKLGISSVGIEANPMASFASRVKTRWDVDPQGLLDHAMQIAAKVSERLEVDGINDEENLPLFRKRRKRDPSLRTLPADAASLLLKNSISPLPLHKTLTLLEVIDEARDERFFEHERLALAKAIVSDIGNLEFGPEVGIGPPKADAPVVTAWLNGVCRMTESLGNWAASAEHLQWFTRRTRGG